MAGIPRAAPLHLQPPPSVPREELARLGIQYLPPHALQDMIAKRNSGQFTLAIVDLRDNDFVGGHIPGCVNLPSRSFVRSLDQAIGTLSSAPLVVFHCLISMHRAPMCAKMYKERLLQLGYNQDVMILEGGFSRWRDLFTGQPWLIEDETLDVEGAQRQYALGFGLGQQFVEDYGAGYGRSQPNSPGGGYAYPQRNAPGGRSFPSAASSYHGQSFHGQSFYGQNFHPYPQATGPYYGQHPGAYMDPRYHDYQENDDRCWLM